MPVRRQEGPKMNAVREMKSHGRNAGKTSEAANKMPAGKHETPSISSGKYLIGSSKTVLSNGMDAHYTTDEAANSRRIVKILTRVS
jgi:hypothetical protein